MVDEIVNRFYSYFKNNDKFKYFNFNIELYTKDIKEIIINECSKHSIIRIVED